MTSIYHRQPWHHANETQINGMTWKATKISNTDLEQNQFAAIRKKVQKIIFTFSAASQAVQLAVLLYHIDLLYLE